MEGKKRYFAIILFLLLGLMIFTFANQDEELEEIQGDLDIGERESVSTKREDSSVIVENNDLDDEEEVTEVVEENTQTVTNNQNVGTNRNITRNNNTNNNNVSNNVDNHTNDNAEKNADEDRKNTEEDAKKKAEDEEKSKQEAYEKALEKVKEAEENHSKDTVKEARDLVDKLEEDQKDELNKRLDEVDKEIEAKELVEELKKKVEESKNKKDIDEAREYEGEKDIENKINSLKDSEFKEQLQKELDEINKILNDKKGPEITGILDGTYTNQDVTLEVKDNNEVNVKVTLNDKEVELKNPFTEEGTYTIVAVDEAFNETRLTFTIDKTAPTIALEDESDLVLEYKVDSFTPSKEDVSYSDDNLSEDPLTIENTIKESEGEYKVTYVVTDKAGNSSSVTRKVIVKDDAYKNAKDALDKAKESKDEKDIKDAEEKIKDVKDDDKRKELEEELQKLKDEIDRENVEKLIEELKKKVDESENKKDIDDARKYEKDEDIENKVKDLNDENLQKELDEINKILNDTKAPEITGIQDGTVTKENVTLEIKDDNEVNVKVTLNDKEVEFKNPFTEEGTYTVVAVDEAFNEIKLTFTIDKTAPTIELVGDKELKLEVGVDTYEEKGATAKDVHDGDLTDKIEVTGKVEDKVGTYEITYVVTDKAGNSSSVTRKVIVKDDAYKNAKDALDKAKESKDEKDIKDAEEKIKDVKDDDKRKELEEELQKLKDEIDRENVEKLIEELKKKVDESENKKDIDDARKYEKDEDIENKVKDLNDENLQKELDEINKILNDTKAPEITGIQDGTVTKENVTLEIKDDNEVNVKVTLNDKEVEFKNPFTEEGTYTVVVTDEAFNETKLTFTIDKTAPVIEMDKDSITLEYGKKYNHEGVTAKDNHDGDLTEKIVKNGEIGSTLGNYTFTYTVTDKALNTATKTRTVTVVDTTKPVITIEKDEVTINLGEDYTDEDVTATDNYDGDLTSKIEKVIPTMNTAGEYIVKYNVEDSSGNKADEITRTVKVVDRVKPTIVVNEKERNDFSSTYEFTVTDNDQVRIVKIAAGDKSDVYFLTSGTEITSDSEIYAYEFTKNGTYTVYADDKSGNMVTKTVEISNLKESEVSSSELIDVLKKNYVKNGSITVSTKDNKDNIQILALGYANMNNSSPAPTLEQFRQNKCKVGSTSDDNCKSVKVHSKFSGFYDFDNKTYMYFKVQRVVDGKLVGEPSEYIFVASKLK